MSRRPVSVAALIALVAALAGCSVEGPEDSVVFEHEDVPFTFQHPPEFTPEEVDGINSRGDVVAVRALDKVDVIAVRRLRSTARERVTRLHVLGKAVTSRVTPVGRGWGIECQYTADRRQDVLDACREALRTLSFR